MQQAMKSYFKGDFVVPTAAREQKAGTVLSQNGNAIMNICPGLQEHSKEDEHDRRKLGNTVLASGHSLGFTGLYSFFQSQCFAFEDNLQKHLTESFCEGRGMNRVGEAQGCPTPDCTVMVGGLC